MKTGEGRTQRAELSWVSSQSAHRRESVVRRKAYGERWLDVEAERACGRERKREGEREKDEKLLS